MQDFVSKLDHQVGGNCISAQFCRNHTYYNLTLLIRSQITYPPKDFIKLLLEEYLNQRKVIDINFINLAITGSTSPIEFEIIFIDLLHWLRIYVSKASELVVCCSVLPFDVYQFCLCVYHKDHPMAADVH